MLNEAPRTLTAPESTALTVSSERSVSKRTLNPGTFVGNAQASIIERERRKINVDRSLTVYLQFASPLTLDAIKDRIEAIKNNVVVLQPLVFLQPAVAPEVWLTLNSSREIPRK